MPCVAGRLEMDGVADMAVCVGHHDSLLRAHLRLAGPRPERSLQLDKLSVAGHRLQAGVGRIADARQPLSPGQQAREHLAQALARSAWARRMITCNSSGV